MRSTLLGCLLLCLIYAAYGGKHFKLGRREHGNLGISRGYHGEKLSMTQWFQQKLDHSNPSDLRTWNQRYFVNDSFYDFKKQGPVFLMIGGEGPADPSRMAYGAWIDYAKQLKALCIYLEHRYYGKSHPTEDTSVKNLQYLSSYQALADLANFIAAMNDKYKIKKDVRWIAFGGSYAGSLAAWLRLKYPHLVYAAVSSSGPLLAKVNFEEYYEVVVDALREKTGGEECVNELKTAHSQITTMMRTQPEIVEKEFRVCQPFAKATNDDINDFYEDLAEHFAALVQYNDIDDYRNLTINTVCNMLTSSGPEPVYKKLAVFNSIMLEKTNKTCLKYSHDDMIKELRNTSWSSGGGRQWIYQTCTEFGFYQTSSGESEVFGNNFPIDFQIKQCEEIFGKKYNAQFVYESAAWANINYGALDIAVSRVVFVHGSIDPWHALGITVTRNKDAPAIFIKGTAHCADIFAPSDNDPNDLIEARIEIMQYLAGWLGQP